MLQTSHNAFPFSYIYFCIIHLLYFQFSIIAAAAKQKKIKNISRQQFIIWMMIVGNFSLLERKRKKLALKAVWNGNANEFRELLIFGRELCVAIAMFFRLTDYKKLKFEISSSHQISSSSSWMRIQLDWESEKRYLSTSTSSWTAVAVKLWVR